jgi:peptidoglycan hydrolase-like protein with peptidoglycan-binding domain
MQDFPDYLGDFERAAFLGALSDYDDNYLGEVLSALGNPASSVLKKGSSGPAVVDLQQKLNRLGYGVSTDGQFGPVTETAVKKFQASVGLTADGIAGSMTLNALNQAVVEVGKTPSTVVKDKPIDAEAAIDKKKKFDFDQLKRLADPKFFQQIRRRGGDAATVIAESIAPGSTRYQLQSQQSQQQEQDEKEEDKGWGPLQWGLLVGGVAVSGLLIYTLVRKHK